MQRFQNEIESDQDIFREDLKDTIWEEHLHQCFVDKHPKCRQDIQKYGNYLAEYFIQLCLKFLFLVFFHSYQHGDYSVYLHMRPKHMAKAW